MGTPNVPFTAYIKLYPKRPPGRLERVRELQKLGFLIQEALLADARFQLAVPGGGQTRNFSRWTDYAGGVAVKPQFGETPPQATIVGYWDNDPDQELVVPPTQPTRQVISGGRVWEGVSGKCSWLKPATTETAEQLKELREQLQSTIAAGLPGGVQFEIFRIDYANEVWGDRGSYFPR